MAPKTSKPKAEAIPGTLVGAETMDDLDALLSSLTTEDAPAEIVTKPEPASLTAPVELDEVVPARKTRVVAVESRGIPPSTSPPAGAILSHATVDPFFDSLVPMDEKPEHLNIVVYGRTGTGKTTFGAQGEKTLVMEIEPHGTFSVASRSLGKGKRKIVKSWADVEETYWWLKKHPGVFDCITFDTGTRMMELCTKSVLVDKETEDFTLLNKDVWKVSLAQRGDAAQRMIFWMSAFGELPMHKIWLMQETTGSGEEAGVGDATIFPDMQKKPRAFLLGDATIVGRMEIRMQQETDGSTTPKYCLFVGADSNIYTKDRTNALGKGLVNPTLEKIVKKVYATKGE